MEWITELVADALLAWQFWAIFGAFLITVEIFDGQGFAVALGLSAMIMAGLELSNEVESFVKFQEEIQFKFLGSWKSALLTYAVISVTLAYFIRKLPMFRTSGEDVNDY